MPIPQLPGSLNTVDDIKNYIMRLERELRFLMESGLDSTNAFEFGGWRVGIDQLASKDNDVGMSTADDGADPIRIWAGDARLASPNFTVTRAGLLTATGALIRSAASGYPRIELNGQDGLFAAYHTATDYIAIDPDATGNATLIFENGLTTILISAILGVFSINALLGNISINAQSGDLFLSAGGGANKVRFVSWADIKNDDTGQTLQQALDAITSSIPSGDYSVITYSGGIATSGRSLVASDIPNIAESQVTGLVTDLAAKASITYVESAIMATNRCASRAYQSVSQTPAAAAFVKMLFQTEVYDYRSNYNPTTSRFTATEAGLYQVSTAIAMTQPADNRTILSIFVNGAEHSRIWDNTAGGTGTISSTMAGSAEIILAVTDYVEIFGYFANAISGTSPGTALTFFSITQLLK